MKEKERTKRKRR